LETITFAKGGTIFISRDRLTSAASPEISQGEPMMGKSVGITALSRLIRALVALVASWMWRARAAGSRMSVASVMVTMLT
jgi:hypothetical protein